jgi:mannan endo-1,4-beta-mannosidase
MKQWQDGKCQPAFVTRNGDKLILKGKEFRFLGTNNYYLHYKDNAMIDDVINNAADMGIKVIRMWAFMDGAKAGDKNGYDIQPEKGVYKARDDKGFGLERVDYTIKKAGEKGIRLVLVLVNYWDDFGGIKQYVEWETGGQNKDEFFTNDKIKQAYQKYVTHVIERTNSYTGVRYKDDPTIMTWELMNEPRMESDKSGNILLGWVAEMSRFVKEKAPRQLVALGDEGFFNHQGESNWAYNGYSGADFDRVIALDSIDYGTAHLYADSWGSGWEEDVLVSGEKWIKAHAESARKAKKPMILEEYGLNINKIKDSQKEVARDLIYEKWNNLIFKEGYNGAMFWILSGIDTSGNAEAGTGLYPDYDGYRVVNNGGRTSELFKTFAGMMSGG